MKCSVYIPEDLAEDVEAYLKAHPDTTLSRLIQDALKLRIGSPKPERILRLAGLVKREAAHARDRAEDRVTRLER